MTFNKPLIEQGSDFKDIMFGGEIPRNTEVSKDLPKIDETQEELEDEVEDTVSDTVETQEEVNDIEEVGESTSEVESEDVETEFEIAAKEMFTKKLITELPKGITEIPDLKTYNKVLEHNYKLREKEVVKEAYQDLTNRLDPVSQQILSFDLDSKNSGGNLQDFIKSLVIIYDVNVLDTEDPIDQEDIIFQYLSSQNMEESEIIDLLETYKENPEKLKKQAINYKPKLVELSKKEAEKQINEQKLIEQEEEEKRDYLSQKLADQLQQGKLGKISDNSDEIPLSHEDATWLLNASLDVKVPAKVKGKKVEMEMFEALAHYHKYHKDGNINVYMTALLLMKDPDKVFGHFKKIAKKEVVKDVRSDNSFANTGLTFTKKKTEIAKPKGKPVYSLNELS